VVADSIPEVAVDHFHLRLSSPNLVFQLHASLVGGVLTTDTAYPDMFALEWYKWDPEQFKLVVSTDSFSFHRFRRTYPCPTLGFHDTGCPVSSVSGGIDETAYGCCTWDTSFRHLHLV
jgi:hypothetical protein